MGTKVLCSSNNSNTNLVHGQIFFPLFNDQSVLPFFYGRFQKELNRSEQSKLELNGSLGIRTRWNNKAIIGFTCGIDQVHNNTYLFREIQCGSEIYVPSFFDDALFHLLVNWYIPIGAGYNNSLHIDHLEKTEVKFHRIDHTHTMESYHLQKINRIEKAFAGMDCAIGYYSFYVDLYARYYKFQKDKVSLSGWDFNAKFHLGESLYASCMVQNDAKNFTYSFGLGLQIKLEDEKLTAIPFSINSLFNRAMIEYPIRDPDVIVHSSLEGGDLISKKNG